MCESVTSSLAFSGSGPLWTWHAHWAMVAFYWPKPRWRIIAPSLEAARATRRAATQLREAGNAQHGQERGAKSLGPTSGSPRGGLSIQARCCSSLSSDLFSVGPSLSLPQLMSTWRISIGLALQPRSGPWPEPLGLSCFFGGHGPKFRRSETPAASSTCRGLTGRLAGQLAASWSGRGLSAHAIQAFGSGSVAEAGRSLELNAVGGRWTGHHRLCWPSAAQDADLMRPRPNLHRTCRRWAWTADSWWQVGFEFFPGSFVVRSVRDNSGTGARRSGAGASLVLALTSQWWPSPIYGLAFDLPWTDSHINSRSGGPP